MPSVTVWSSPASAVGSSSVIVSVTFVGAVTPLAFCAVAETVTSLFAAVAALSTASMVTWPMLVVAPAAMERVLFVLSAKSPATALAPATAETVTVVAALDAGIKVAFTVVKPFFSEMEENDRVNVTTDLASSSLSVRAAAFTVPMPWLLPALPVTCTSRPAPLSTSSFTAVIDAVSEASDVTPATITMVAFVESTV